VLKVIPIVGLKHAPESLPSAAMRTYRVNRTVIVPIKPSDVGAIFEYLVCRITPTNKIVNIISSKNTCHKGKL